MKTVKVRSWVGGHTLQVDDEEFGIIDRECVKAFTLGQCHAFAVAIHRLTGWTIKGIKPYPDSRYLGHCVNYSPELKGYVDIRGLVKKVDRFNWGRQAYVAVSRLSESTIVNQGLDGYMEPDVENAMPFARTLLNKLGITPQPTKKSRRRKHV
jgi:hypothetical protein